MGMAFRTDNGDMCNSEMFAYGQMRRKRLCINTKRETSTKLGLKPAVMPPTATLSTIISEATDVVTEEADVSAWVDRPVRQIQSKPVQFGRGAHSVNNEATSTKKDE